MEETLDSVLEEWRTWRKESRGSTTDELLALEGKRESPDLVFAFDDALRAKFERAVGAEMWEGIGRDAILAQIWDFDAGRAARGPLTEEELIILVVVEFRGQTRNGGFDAFFHHQPEFTLVIGKALRRIGRSDLAEVAERAVECLGVSKQEFKGQEYFDRVSEAVCPDDLVAQAEIDAKLDKCTDELNEIYDDILDSLFEFIKKNRDKIVVGPKEWGPAKPDPSAPPVDGS